MIHSKELLDETRRLLSLPPRTHTEVRRRTIISRAYYAAYHHMRGHPCANNYVFRSDGKFGMHRDFLGYLRSSRDKDVLHAAMLLNLLLELRIKADYHLDKDLRPGIEKECVENAEGIMIDILGTDENL